jgi:hypothetical protein
MTAKLGRRIPLPLRCNQRAYLLPTRSAAELAAAGVTGDPYIDGPLVRVDGNCSVTGKPHSVTVPLAGLDRWIYGGAFIQDALPNVPAEQREFLQSGLSPDGWATVFPPEETDDE